MSDPGFAIRGERSELGAPSPAAPEGCEDEGQRCAEDMSDSEMSDKYPAGLHRYGPLKRHSRGSSDNSSAKLERSLDIRLSVADREAVWDRARVLGVKPSAWGRAAVLDALDARRSNVDRMHVTATTAPDPERAAAIEQLRRIGVNLNQALMRGLVVDELLLRQLLATLDGTRAAFGDRTSL